MPRKRDPRRDEAFNIWKDSNGERKLKDIATELNISGSQIRKWKSQDKWSEKVNGNVTNSKRSVTKQKDTNGIRDATHQEKVTVQNDELTDKQRLFCIYYIKSFNATMAAIKAGYSPDTAHVQGSRLLKNAKVSKEIRSLKQEMQQGIFIEAMDVLNKYIQIAFADIADYATFGKKEIEIMGSFGPLEDEDGNPIMKEMNYVDFNESYMVDGTIITEVKQGKEGISVKLADKMKALEMLAKYFDLLSENDKKRLQEEKLKAETEKAKAEAARLSKENVDDDLEEIIIVDEWGHENAEK